VNLLKGTMPMWGMYYWTRESLEKEIDKFLKEEYNK
jgi:hypothetical protein